jgi:hypothetical protein
VPTGIVKDSSNRAAVWTFRVVKRIWLRQRSSY